jgi:hypothetical protein
MIRYGTKADWAELEEHIRLADMHEAAGPDEDIDGCLCNRCVSIREAN